MMNEDLPKRRATDRGEPSNREIMSKLGVIEAYIARHTVDHNAITVRLASDDVATALCHAQLAGLMRMTDELAGLHDFRVQVQTIGASIKWVVGGSLIAAMTGIISLAMTLTHWGIAP
jgi:hypothetical protein